MQVEKWRQAKEGNLFIHRADLFADPCRRALSWFGCRVVNDVGREQMSRLGSQITRGLLKWVDAGLVGTGPFDRFQPKNEMI